VALVANRPVKGTEAELIEYAFIMFESEAYNSFEQCFKFLRAFGGSMEAAKGAIAFAALQDRD